MDILDDLLMKMISYNSGDPKRIQHLIKVHSFARLIGLSENLESDTQFILEAAAIVHDIGIKPAEEKYGYCNGKLQEQEGPEPAEKLLRSLGFRASVVDRVCYLVGHHHTYSDVDGLDYQILLEADFLDWNRRLPMRLIIISSGQRRGKGFVRRCFFKRL